MHIDRCTTATGQCLPSLGAVHPGPGPGRGVDETKDRGKVGNPPRCAERPASCTKSSSIATESCRVLRELLLVSLQGSSRDPNHADPLSKLCNRKSGSYVTTQPRSFISIGLQAIDQMPSVYRCTQPNKCTTRHLSYLIRLRMKLYMRNPVLSMNVSKNAITTAAPIAAPPMQRFAGHPAALGRVLPYQQRNCFRKVAVPEIR